MTTDAIHTVCCHGGDSTGWHFHGLGMCRRHKKPMGKQSSRIQHAMKTGHTHVFFLLLRNTAYTGCAAQRFITFTMAISSAANTSTRANGAIIQLNFNGKLYQTDDRSKQTQISDGILRGWVDDQLVFENSDVRMRDVDTQDRNRLAEPLLRRHLNCQVRLPRLHRRCGNQQNTHRPVGGQPVNDSC